ncbi:MAG TPA: HAD hydrolase-like protein [Micromonosporaceae bacterium]|nr:HAD hydrolase-like protein [Micromonosporaceae bacterium]
MNVSSGSRVPRLADVDAVLLDLDGTLVDSAEGILGSLRAAFAERGVLEPDGGLGSSLLGPPLYATLLPLVGPPMAEEIAAAYRRIYADAGWLQSTPYDGVDALLRDLVSAGLRIAVATSKQEQVAHLIVEKHGWADLFTFVCGDTPRTERSTKAAVIGEALARLGRPASLMVGDRSYDVVGARAHGLDCIGAGWGYAQPGELAAAGAAFVCVRPSDLGMMIRWRNAGGRPQRWAEG